MTKFITKELLSVEKPKAKFKPDFRLSDIMRVSEQGIDRTVMEFVGTGDFASQWVERQRFEVDAGRDEEPLLYANLYEETSDPSFPRNVTVYRVGPGAVVFELVNEGGEAKMVTVEESNYAVVMQHYAAALEYTKDLVVYNELWNLPLIERQAGKAFNALKNHVHLSPFTGYAYTNANQTAASAVGATIEEKFLRTLEDAIANSSDDTTNPRFGPFALLCSTRDAMTWRRVLNPVQQWGVDVGSSEVRDMIRFVIGYNGWTGRRGNKTTTYPGVTSGKTYLIDISDKMRNLRSFVKQDLDSVMGNPDVTRFVMEQVVYDAYFTNYADVAATTEEITNPTS